jgi:SAM-dependent methyltransferase
MSAGVDLSDFDHRAWPRRLNLGCGWDKRPGYLNVDFQAYHEPDLVADVVNLSMLPDGHYSEIVAQDVLEHLTRAEGPRALREWARLLQPGGVLILRLPNLLGLAYLFTRLRDVDEQEQLVQCLYGTQAYDGDFHHNGYTELLLRHHLREAGFGRVRIEPRDEWLFDVEATRVQLPDEGEPAFENCAYMTLEQPSVVAARLAGVGQDLPGEPSEPHYVENLAASSPSWLVRSRSAARAGLARGRGLRSRAARRGRALRARAVRLRFRDDARYLERVVGDAIRAGRGN